MYQNLYGKVFVRFPRMLPLFLTCKIAAVTLNLTALGEKVTGRQGSRSAFYTSQKKTMFPWVTRFFSWSSWTKKGTHVHAIASKKVGKARYSYLQLLLVRHQGNKWQGLELPNWQEGRRWLLLSASKSLVEMYFNLKHVGISFLVPLPSLIMSTFTNNAHSL